MSYWSSDVCSSDLGARRSVGWVGPINPASRRVRLPRIEAGLVKPTQPTVLAGVGRRVGRRLGWRHQPSVLRVRSPGLEAGLVKPTQPTILGWPHKPSVLRVRTPGLEAGLVKPTKPTEAAGRLAENARQRGSASCRESVGQFA